MTNEQVLKTYELAARIEMKYKDLEYPIGLVYSLRGLLDKYDFKDDEVKEIFVSQKGLIFSTRKIVLFTHKKLIVIKFTVPFAGQYSRLNKNYKTKIFIHDLNSKIEVLTKQTTHDALIRIDDKNSYSLILGYNESNAQFVEFINNNVPSIIVDNSPAYLKNPKVEKIKLTNDSEKSKKDDDSYYLNEVLFGIDPDDYK